MLMFVTCNICSTVFRVKRLSNRTPSVIVFTGRGPIIAIFSCFCQIISMQSDTPLQAPHNFECCQSTYLGQKYKFSCTSSYQVPFVHLLIFVTESGGNSTNYRHFGIIGTPNLLYFSVNNYDCHLRFNKRPPGGLC